MQRVSDQSTHLRILADVVALSLITLFVEHKLMGSGFHFFSAYNLLILLLNLTCWFVSARTMGLYVDFRSRAFSVELVAFIKATLLYTLITSFILLQFLQQYPFHRKELLWISCIVFFVFPLQKLVIRLTLKKLNNTEQNVRKVLIVGAGDAGQDFYKQCIKNRHFGYKLTGFVDEEAQPTLNGKYLGKTTELDKVLAKHELDDIVVALPAGEESQIERIVSIGEKEGKRIRIIPSYQRYNSGRMHVEQVGVNMPIITLRSLPLDVIDNKIVKRIFDVVFSLLVIVCVFPWLLPIIAIAIKLSSKGPVFFRQERWGLNNKVITCLKFRSMQSCSRDLDEQGNYLQACKNDPRVTRVGAFLRKTNLDELPQFFNVLLGSMSVVGPRPHPVPLNMASKNSVNRYMMRHWVKPGITGWAQVNGFRGETRVPYLMEKRVEHDVWYIENWTFWLDLQIVVQTLTNMIKGEKNAF
ncbi:undecaprenyl-phosphate glucose phosphotransferase [Paracnuella aquatica]|uniref:undecaprenyl-phosphate glucose phosphotransferase n=1 Tax=Paracnuella aquatica TaxID=2268757 RepID=UPI000DF00DED|nr:undecaprenyl-phosphate glucose phosphotransferase [Paracnuella aquatica]RPD51029.1 undecaprenyl-phosphate glucose phosphotransferase [Paracnuella aquatica]